MGFISLLISLFLASVTHSLRQHWKRLLSDRIIERALGDADRTDREVRRRENVVVVWHIIYLGTLYSALASLGLTLKEFGFLNWLLK